MFARLLSGPTLNETGGIEPAGHGPRIEPTPRKTTSFLAQLHYESHIVRSFVETHEACPVAAHRALRLPGAEDIVQLVEPLAG